MQFENRHIYFLSSVMLKIDCKKLQIFRPKNKKKIIFCIVGFFGFLGADPLPFLAFFTLLGTFFWAATLKAYFDLMSLVYQSA